MAKRKKNHQHKTSGPGDFAYGSKKFVLSAKIPLWQSFPWKKSPNSPSHWSGIYISSSCFLNQNSCNKKLNWNPLIYFLCRLEMTKVETLPFSIEHILGLKPSVTPMESHIRNICVDPSMQTRCIHPDIQTGSYFGIILVGII